MGLQCMDVSGDVNVWVCSGADVLLYVSLQVWAHILYVCRSGHAWEIAHVYMSMSVHIGLSTCICMHRCIVRPLYACVHVSVSVSVCMCVCACNCVRMMAGLCV